MSNDKPIFEGWAILELMGHRRLGGYVSQAEMFGTAMLRIDVPGPDETCALCCGGKVEAVGADGPIVCGACEGKGQKPTIAATQFYSGGSIYCLTPTTEEVARAVAAHHQPTPVQRWELPALPPVAESAGADHDPDDDQDYDDDDGDY